MPPLTRLISEKMSATRIAIFGAYPACGEELVEVDAVANSSLSATNFLVAGIREVDARGFGVRRADRRREEDLVLEQRNGQQFARCRAPGAVAMMMASSRPRLQLLEQQPGSSRA